MNNNCIVLRFKIWMYSNKKTMNAPDNIRKYILLLIPFGSNISVY